MRHLILNLFIALWTLSPALAQATEIDISPERAAELLEAGKAILVDVRESDEIATGMAKPAVWLPMSDITAGGERFERFLEELSTDHTVIVYCATGRRAGVFVSVLKERGITARNMGGFEAWANADLPTRIPDDLN